MKALIAICQTFFDRFGKGYKELRHAEDFVHDRGVQLAVEAICVSEVSHVMLGKLTWSDLKRNSPYIEEFSGLKDVFVRVLVNLSRLLENLRFFVNDRSIYNLNDSLRLDLLLLFSLRSILIHQRVQITVIFSNEKHSLIIKLFKERILFSGCKKRQ